VNALRSDEREEISRGLAASRSVRDIARRLGRSPSTICREINRNGGRAAYRADKAEQHARVAALSLEGLEPGDQWTSAGHCRPKAGTGLVSGTSVRSIKSECLRSVIPLGERHLRALVAEYVEHYHLERNHQGLDNMLIDRLEQGASNDNSRTPIRCRERLGGTLRYYYRDAA
jgi:hypothetical protein